MPLRDPVSAYNAASNLEAHLVCGMLQDAGIEANVIEDNSLAGGWMGGMSPEIHKPQVWIERADIERAGPVLAAYEQKTIDSVNPAADVGTIDADCDECGETTTFPATDKGSVQSCRHCGEYLDVGEAAPIDGWQLMTDATSEEFEEEEAEDDSREDE